MMPVSSTSLSSCFSSIYICCHYCLFLSPFLSFYFFILSFLRQGEKLEGRSSSPFVFPKEIIELDNNFQFLSLSFLPMLFLIFLPIRVQFLSHSLSFASEGLSSPMCFYFCALSLFYYLHHVHTIGTKK